MAAALDEPGADRGVARSAPVVPAGDVITLPGTGMTDASQSPSKNRWCRTVPLTHIRRPLASALSRSATGPGAKAGAGA